MLVGLLNGQRVNCYSGEHDRETLKKWAHKGIILCPACNKPYEYCHGKINAPYFRHKDKEQCIGLYSEPETQEHIAGKALLFQWISGIEGVTDAVLEGWLPATRQRPDIMFCINKQQYVIEYQCSPIASEYVERHELYKAAGIVDIWLCGINNYKLDATNEMYGINHKKIRRVLELACAGYLDSQNGVIILNSSKLSNLIKYGLNCGPRYYTLKLMDCCFDAGVIYGQNELNQRRSKNERKRVIEQQVHKRMDEIAVECDAIVDELQAKYGRSAVYFAERRSDSYLHKIILGQYTAFVKEKKIDFCYQDMGRRPYYKYSNRLHKKVVAGYEDAMTYYTQESVKYADVHELYLSIFGFVKKYGIK